MPLAAPVTIATLSVKRAIAFVYGVARGDHARAQDIDFDERKTLAWVARVTGGLRFLARRRTDPGARHRTFRRDRVRGHERSGFGVVALAREQGAGLIALGVAPRVGFNSSNVPVLVVRAPIL